MVSVEDLTFSYGEKIVLRDVNFDHDEGILGILGPNGSGKTTLLKLMNALLKPQSGDVKIDGESVFSMKRKDLSKRITLVSQELRIVFDYRVIDVVLMGSISRKIFPDEDEIERARDLLKEMGISHLSDRRLGSLSGGERRIVLLSKAIFQGCDLIAVDELELHLDPKHKVEIASLMRDLSRKGKIVIAVFHDINLALSVSDRIIGLKDGKILFDTDPRDDSVPRLLEDLYQTRFESFRFKKRWVLVPSML